MFDDIAPPHGPISPGQRDELSASLPKPLLVASVAVLLFATMLGVVGFISMLPGCATWRQDVPQAVNIADQTCQLIERHLPTGVIEMICLTIDEIDAITKEIGHKPTAGELIERGTARRAAMMKRPAS